MSKENKDNEANGGAVSGSSPSAGSDWVAGSLPSPAGIIYTTTGDRIHCGTDKKLTEVEAAELEIRWMKGFLNSRTQQRRRWLFMPAWKRCLIALFRPHTLFSQNNEMRDGGSEPQAKE